MAIRTVAQAAADIRLGSDKANADFERIRRDLINKAQRLEADLAVSVPLTLDQASLQQALTRVSRTTIPPIPVTLALDPASAFEDFFALSELFGDEPIRVPIEVDVDTEDAIREITSLGGTEIAVQVPVHVDDERAATVIGELRDTEIPIVAPVEVDTDRAFRDILGLSDAVGDDFVVELRADAAPARTAIGALGTLVDQTTPILRVLADVEQATGEITALGSEVPPVDVSVDADTEQAETDIRALGENRDPVLVPVVADTAGISEQIRSIDTPPVPVRFTTPGIAVNALARIRADLDSLDAAPPVNIQVDADTDQAAAEITALGRRDPVVVPVEANTDDARSEITALGNTQPVVVPVSADTTQALDQIRQIEPDPIPVRFTTPGINPTALSRIRADLASIDDTPLVVAVAADVDQARADITALGGPTEPVVVPVDADVDQAQAAITALGGPGTPPVVVPVSVNSTAAVAQARQTGQQIGDAIEPGAREGGRVAGLAFGREFSQTANRILSVAAITVGGLLATSLFEGFQRFTTIEDSTESLTVALQSASEAGQVLSDVLNVVRGTPFRLDDFARAATNMISFGIAAEKVPRFLTAIGEAAATRGSQANQFAQSLSTIFGQIQAIGRINGEDVWQFGNVGVDVLRILGNTLGETTEQIRKMISEGLIPADFALEAIASGILNGTDGVNGATVAFAGVMERLGDTLSGSIENFGAARARFGVAIIDPLSDTLIAGFQSATAVVDDFTARTRAAFDNLAETPMFDAINGFFERAPSLIEPTVDALSQLGPALAPLAIAFGALGLGALGSVLGPLGALIPGVTSLAGAFGVAATAAAVLTPEIRDELLPALVEFGEVGAEVGGSFVRGLSGALEAVSPTVVRAIGVARATLPEIQGFLATAFAAVGDIGDAALPVLDRLVTFAEEALPTAFRIAADGVVLLSRVAVAAAPTIDKLIQAGTDLLPAIEQVVEVGEGVAGVLVPALEGLGEVIGAIPTEVITTLLGAFLGFKTVQFVSGVFDSIALSASKASTSVGNFARNMAVGVPLASQAAIAAGTAVSGAFAGMALASEDSSTRIVGAIGSIGTVLTGFALGGAPGGIFAAIGVGIGYIAQGFIDSRERAEELERAVSSLADRIRSEFNGQLVTPEGIINAQAFEETILQGVGTDALRTLEREIGVGFEEIQAAASIQAQQVQQAIRDGLDPGEVTFFDDFINESIGRLARIRAAAEDINFSEALNEEIAGVDFSKLNGAEFVKVSKDLAKQFGLDAEDVRDQIRLTGRVLDELGPDFQDTMSIVGQATTEALVTQDYLKDSVTATGDAAESAGEQAADALAKWKADTAETTLSADELRAMFTEAGEEAKSAAEVATEAFGEFEEVLDRIRGKLDLTVSTQNLNNDLRDMSEAFGEIVNLDELNRVEDLNDQIGRVQSRIADLQGNLAEETARANEEAALLDQRIAKADAIGAVNAAAELRRQRGEVFDDVDDVRADIDDEFARLRELEDELRGLSSVPITLGEQLIQQAADANMTLFEFLLAAPTEESRRFFQDNIAGVIEGGLARAAAIAEVEGPLAGARAAEELRAGFEASALAAGIDPGTVAALINELLPADQLATGAQEAAEAAVTAFFAGVEAINTDPDATTFEIKAAALDLEQQAAEIDAFLAENPGITLPADIDTTKFDAAVEALRTKAAQIEIESERTRFGERNPEALNEFIRATQTDAEKAAQESAQKILDEINALNPDTMDIPVEVTGIQSEIEELQALLNETGVDLPATLNIQAVTNSLTQAQMAALAQAQLEQIAPAFFAHGGIAGREDHKAQIAHGLRFWAEPETGGEAYLPLGMGKRVSALGVFMKVADIFDLEVRPKDEVRVVMPPMPPAPIERHYTREEIRNGIPALAAAVDRSFTTLGDTVVTNMYSRSPTVVHAPDVRVPDVYVTVVAPPGPPAPAPSRPPVTQAQYDGAIHIDKIERLVIGDGASARKRASQLIRELKKRAIGL